jgi:hypothetical protein
MLSRLENLYRGQHWWRVWFVIFSKYQVQEHHYGCACFKYAFHVFHLILYKVYMYLVKITIFYDLFLFLFAWVVWEKMLIYCTLYGVLTTRKHKGQRQK